MNFSLLKKLMSCTGCRLTGGDDLILGSGHAIPDAVKNTAVLRISVEFYSGKSLRPLN